MGRFYRTASANPLDYMYKINTPLMEKVIETNDQYITDELSQAGQLGTLATNFPYLQPDEQRAKEISDQYSKHIDDITATIRNDPANWRSQQNVIQDVSRDLVNNYRTGEISKIASNYSKYKSVSDYIDKQVEEYGKSGKGISADRARAYKQMFLSNFTKANPNGTSYDPKTGEYNSLEAYNPMSNIDVRKSLAEELDKMKTDGEIRITDNITGNGEYFNKQTEKWEGITPEKILRIVTDRLNNPQLMDYLKQDTQAGIINGVFNNDPSSPEYGKFIAPYNYNKVGLTSSEQSVLDSMKKQISGTKNNKVKSMLQEQLNDYTNKLNQRTKLDWNNGSYLAPIMRGVVDEFSSSKTEQANDLSANPIWSSRFTQSQENIRNDKNIAAREKMQDKLFQHQKNMQQKKLDADRFNKLFDWGRKNIPKAGTSSLLKTDKSTSLGANNINPTTGTATTRVPKMENAVVGQLYTTPFYYTTEDKDKLTTSLNDEINTYTITNKNLGKTLGNLQKDHPESKVLISNAQNQIASNNAKLATLYDRRENAIRYGLDKWKENEGEDYRYTEYGEQLTRSFISGDLKSKYDSAKANMTKVELQKKQLNVQPGGKEESDFHTNVYYPAMAALQRATATLQEGQNYFNEIKPYTDNKLEKAAKETTGSSTIVSTTDNQDKSIVSMITTTPSNYKIIGKDGKETNLSFEHGTAVTDPSKFQIKGVAHTTGIGSIEISATINGKDVIITPKDDDGRLATYLGTELKNSKNKDVSNIGRIISSPTASTVADMLSETRMNTNTPYGTKDSWVYRTIQNPTNPAETIEVRARSISTGSTEPKWELQFKTNNPHLVMSNAGKSEVNFTPDGKMTRYVPLTSTKSPSGEYHNLEDILSIFPTDQ